MGKPATPDCSSTRDSSVTGHCSLRRHTLRSDAEKSQRQDHLCALQLRKLPFMLLRLLPRHGGALGASFDRPFAAELTHLRSHQVGVAEAAH
jgi:hypothetical protein